MATIQRFFGIVTEFVIGVHGIWIVSNSENVPIYLRANSNTIFATIARENVSRGSSRDDASCVYGP